MLHQGEDWCPDALENAADHQSKLNRTFTAWRNAKEVILEMLRRVGIKGGLGKVFEYVGPGAATLSVSERASITNMGAEMGATTSIFPADERVR